MSQKLVFLLTTLLFSVGTFSQSVSNINFSQNGQQIVINYDITGSMRSQNFNVSVYVSRDGGRRFTGPLKKVSGDVGFNVQGGRGKSITWDVMQEQPDFGGNIVFDVRAVVTSKQSKQQTVSKPKPKPKPKLKPTSNSDFEPKFYVGYKATTKAPIGITVGKTGKVGLYASARLNAGFFGSYDYETDGSTIIDFNESGYYNFTSNYKTQRLSITLGTQFYLGQYFHLYLGAGYAVSNILWEVEQYDYSGTQIGQILVKDQLESFSGVELETGLMVELGSVYIAGGIAVPGFKTVEPEFSLGLLF